MGSAGSPKCGALLLRLMMAVLCAAASVRGQSVLPTPWPVADPGAITTQQEVVPAGVSAVVSGMVTGVAFRGPAEILAVAGTHLYRFDPTKNVAVQLAGVGPRPGLQGLILDPATNNAILTSTLTGTSRYGQGMPVALLTWLGSGPVQLTTGDLGIETGGRPGLAATKNPSGIRPAVVPLTANNQVAVIDLESRKEVFRVETGQAPFAAAVNRTGTFAWVTNWGGRLAEEGDLTAGVKDVVIDEHGRLKAGSVVRIDLSDGSITHTIETGLHPTALVWDEAAERLYIANSLSDALTVVDTQKLETIGVWPLTPAGTSVLGIAPSALVLTPDGKRLFVACAGVNAVAVVETAGGSVAGWIPTPWYPTTIDISPDGTHLAVGSLLGPGTGELTSGRRTIQAKRGTVSYIRIPDEHELAAHTQAALTASRLDRGTDHGPRRTECRSETAEPVPACANGTSPIKNVVLIIKENRTYDQILGDLWQGNGNLGMAMYTGHITPNHHRLAEQFVTLDNFYATGGVSAEGHLWLTQANAPSYTVWPGYFGRSYPFDGTDPMAYSPGGFLWESAKAAGKSVRVYGEMAPSVAAKGGDRRRLLMEWAMGVNFSGRFSAVAQIPSLQDVLAPDYPSYNISIPDVVRAQLFLRDLARWSTEGGMPNLVVLQLPSDHTMGVSPGESTPAAMVADNDLALGRIVEELSKSPFWKEMVIFVVEDDAQDGVDHVDGHRTVALAISPYTKRGHIDSTFYSHQSMVKSIELILGLPPLTLFDLIATDMRESFTSEPNYTPYDSEVPQVSLFETNPALGALSGQARRDAQASMKMNWAVPDEAPWAELNRILWRAAKGQKAKYPGVREAAFRPPMVETAEEEERERAGARR